MKTKRLEDKTDRAFSNERIASESSSRKVTDFLKTLTNSHLNELWLTAARLGEERICEQIETVRFERLERERKQFYEQYCN